MKYRFGDTGGTASNRAEVIRQLFVPGTSIAAHTEKCKGVDVWTPSELAGLATRACREEVRRALRAPDDEQMPFAGPTTSVAEDGSPKWRQRSFWSEDDYALNCSHYREDAASGLEVHNRLALECWQKYGRGPKTLVLTEEEPVL
jgi:hypothetical protein